MNSFQVSHYGASWFGDPNWSEPVYPGKLHDKYWDRDILRELYTPWVEVEKTGVQIHVGECGCYNKIPNDVALCWLTDLFSIYHELGWGFALGIFRAALA